MCGRRREPSDGDGGKLPVEAVRTEEEVSSASIASRLSASRFNPLAVMSVSREDVRHVAQLARLDFSEEEEGQMAEELSQILDYVDKLDELDTSGVPPMSHVLDITNVFRPDEVEERIDRGQALEPAPEADDEFFQVPKVIGEG